MDVRDKSLTASCVAKATNGTPLYQIIPEEFKNTVLAEVEEFSPTKTETQQAEEEKPEGMTIKLTSFEGAKGLSAQHVFLVGLQAGDLPRDAKNIQDLEICKFLVGLTRTKKRCTMLWTKCFGSDWKQPSVFLDWIQSKRYESFSVDKNYWDRQK